MSKRQTTSQSHRDPWLVIERIPDLNYVMTYTILKGYGRYIQQQGGGNFIREIIFIIEDGNAKLCYRRDQLHRTAQYIAAKAVHDVAWLAQANRVVEVAAHRYRAVAAQQLRRRPYQKLSDQALAKALLDLIMVQGVSHATGQTTTWLIDAEEHFTTYLLDHLKARAAEQRLKLNLAEVFSALTTPLKPSYTEIESREILALAVRIGRRPALKRLIVRTPLDELPQALRRADPALLRALTSHQRRWFWLHHNYRGPVLDLAYFLQVFQGLVKQGNAARLLAQAKASAGRLRKQQTALVKQLKLDAKHRALLDQARYIVWLKSYRKDCMYYGAYVINGLLRELARRCAISFTQAEFLAYPEYAPALLKGSLNPTELMERKKFSVIYGSWDGIAVYTGQRARSFLNRLPWEREQSHKVAVLTGQPACPGCARGRVTIVDHVSDIPKMHQGDILLSETTYPALVPAMKKAAAIVTNMGGLTCHAAIISRELKIPCVVGTKIATRVFKDGDRVEVDATNGVVRKL